MVVDVDPTAVTTVAVVAAAGLVATAVPVTEAAAAVAAHARSADVFGFHRRRHVKFP
jgi:hypothetical protein